MWKPNSTYLLETDACKTHKTQNITDTKKEFNFSVFVEYVSESLYKHEYTDENCDCDCGCGSGFNADPSFLEVKDEERID